MAASWNMVVWCIYLVCSKCQGYVYWFQYNSCILNKYHWTRKTAGFEFFVFLCWRPWFFHHCPRKLLKSSFALTALCTCSCVVSTSNSGDILTVTGLHDMSTARLRVSLRSTMPTVVLTVLLSLNDHLQMDYKRWEFFVFLVLSRGHEFWVDLNVMKLYETVEFDQMRRLSTPSCPSSSSNYYTVWKYFCRDHFGWREYSEVFSMFQNPAFGL